MSWNRTGTVSVTNGSQIVNGAGTAWVANARVSEAFKGPDGQLYEIASINGDGQMTLASPYLGATAAGQAYVIVPTQGYIRDLAAQAAALINQFADVVNGAGAGKFAQATSPTPTLRSVGAETSGIGMVGGAVDIVTSGVIRLRWSQSGSPSSDTGFWPINLSGSFNQSAKLQNLATSDANNVAKTTAGVDTSVGKLLPGGYSVWYFTNSAASPGSIVANGNNDGALENLQYSPDGASSYAHQRFSDWRNGDFYTRAISGGNPIAWRKVARYETDGVLSASAIKFDDQPNFTVGALQPGNGDGATLATVNMALSCWYGLGITNRSGSGGAIGVNGISHVFNARSGDSMFRGELTNLGAAFFGPTRAGGYAGIPFTFVQTAAQVDNATAMAVGNGTVPAMLVSAQSGAAPNLSQPSVLFLRASSATGRSASLGGTLNASGSDYAEYHGVAEHAIGKVAKGQLVGFTVDDLVTTRWSEAVSGFGVKTTNPSYVGGDTWASVEAIGVAEPQRVVFIAPERPVFVPPNHPPVEPSAVRLDASDEELRAYMQARVEFEEALTAYRADTAQARVKADAAYDESVATAQAAFEAGPQAAYTRDLAVFEAAAEAARQKVDRIAYSGRVPVNVQGAKPGDYIVAEEGPGDTITGVVLTTAQLRADMTRYLTVVGRVRSILADGRANVAVVIH